ncbi:hypothetical protein ABT304_04970 [Nocardioides sp. NPDC000445]|uniref:hypothetical protein n=1 Tax=Nocardioides sp. NPDC000445 TaxID=3154257 RepID=UPI0033291B7A
MAGSGSTGVDKALVAKMTQVLMDSKVDIDKVNVDKPAGGTMGGSKTAGNLSSLVDLATDRINSALSETSNALIDFVDGLHAAERAITDSDEEAKIAFNNKMTSAVSAINQPFFENLFKDDRPDIPGFQIPFLPLTPDQLQEIVSRSEFGQDQEDQK